MTFADKVLALRKKSGLSQEELAEKLEVSRQAISRWEMGLAMPDASNLLQLSKLFNVTTDYLINDEYSSDEDIPIVKIQEDTINREKKKLPTIIKTILIGAAISVLLAILFFPFVVELPILIIPIIVLPFPTFYFSAFYKDLLSLKLILSINAILLLVVNAIAIVGFWISYNIHYGEAYTHLILWSNVICFINAAALISFGSFIAFAASSNKWWVSLLIYVFFSALWTGVACALYSITSDNSLSHIITLIISSLICIVGCMAYTLRARNYKKSNIVENCKAISP